MCGDCGAGGVSGGWGDQAEQRLDQSFSLSGPTQSTYYHFNLILIEKAEKS